MQKTRYVNSQIGSAVNEKQEIRVNSIKHPETQVSNKAENFLTFCTFNKNQLTTIVSSSYYILLKRPTK